MFLLYSGREASYHRFALDLQTSGKVYGSVFAESAVGVSTLSANTWYHLALTSESAGKTIKVWINGSVDVSKLLTGTLNSDTDDLAVGDATSAVFPATADIAEVCVYSAALGAERLGMLADGFSPQRVDPSNLVYYAPLIRDWITRKGAGSFSVTGSVTVGDHPRIFY
jgi:hypothetical protein